MIIYLVYAFFSKGLSILYRVKHILNYNALYTLYNSLILPYYSYACEIWGNNCYSRLKCLILLQKRAIRLVSKAKFRDHTSPLFVKLKLLKFTKS